MIFVVEESVKRKSLGIKNKKGRGFIRRRKHISICNDPDCNIVCHTSCPPESKMRLHPQFNGMTCFQIAHYPDCQSFFYEVNKGGKTYT